MGLYGRREGVVEPLPRRALKTSYLDLYVLLEALVAQLVCGCGVRWSSRPGDDPPGDHGGLGGEWIQLLCGLRGLALVHAHQIDPSPRLSFGGFLAFAQLPVVQAEKPDVLGHRPIGRFGVSRGMGDFRGRHLGLRR